MKRAVMRRAWEIRKRAARRFGCKVSEIHFGECLRQAWAEVKAQKEEKMEFKELTSAEYRRLDDAEKTAYRAAKRTAKRTARKARKEEEGAWMRKNVPAGYEFRHCDYCQLTGKLTGMFVGLPGAAPGNVKWIEYNG